MKRLIFFVSLIALGACAAPEPEPSVSRVPLEPCKVPGPGGEVEVLCGTLEVYENRAARSGRRIGLNVVVVPALSDTPAPDPVFNLAGGPGVPATGAAGFFASELSSLRQNRDIVLVDQRGTGGSNPLHCVMRTGTPNTHGLFNEMFPPDAVAACRRELEDRADLTRYTTADFVADIDEVRAWLGYERINLTGLSYGTRSAQEYLRRYPQRVRAAVLEGAVDPGLHMPMHHAPDGAAAMDLVLDDCLSDPACASAFPNVREQLVAVLERLDAGPALATVQNPDDGSELEIEIQRDVFAELLRNRLYSPAGGREVPFMIQRAYQGDFGPVLRASLPGQIRTLEAPFLADGLYLSITCSEDVPFIDPQAAMRLSRNTYFGSYRIEQQRRACSFWPRGEVREDFHTPVRSHVPVLLLSGRLDPVTPPYRAERVARHLANSGHVVIRHSSHGVEGLSRLDCYTDLIVEFLENPDPARVDPRCTDEMLPPPFVTGNDAGNALPAYGE